MSEIGLTLFELDPDPGVGLNLLDHLSVPANDDADGKSGHHHLIKGGGEGDASEVIRCGFCVLHTILQVYLNKFEYGREEFRQFIKKKKKETHKDLKHCKGFPLKTSKGQLLPNF